MVTVDSETPLVPTWGGRNRAAHPLMVLLSKLEVGESFTWPPMERDNLALLRRRAHNYGHTSGKRFATRLVTRGKGKPTMMFWRLK